VNRRTTVQPADEKADELFCMQEGTPVRSDAPQCLHPSSYCPFRDSCPITELLRESRRNRDEGESV